TQETSGVSLGDEVYAGLYVCSHNNSVVEKAVFRDVEITVPARDNFVPYREYIGSNLEVIHLEESAKGPPSSERFAAGSLLDARWQGSHLQSQWFALPLRSGNEHAGSL